MQDISWINDLKIVVIMKPVIRISATTGHLSTMSGFGYYYYNGQWLQVWGPGKNVNNDLHWERQKLEYWHRFFAIKTIVFPVLSIIIIVNKQIFWGDYNVLFHPICILQLCQCWNDEKFGI